MLIGADRIDKSGLFGISIGTLVLLVLILSPSIAYAQEDSAVEECIKKYQGEGLSYEDAKAKCTATQTEETKEEAKTTEPAETPKPQEPEQTGDACITKYQGAGYSYEEAKKKCYPEKTPAPTRTPAPAEDVVLECIAKYQKEKGLSYGEAKKLCVPVKETPAPTRTPAPAEDAVLECIAKYQKERGLSYADAKGKCTGVAKPTPVAINRCTELEKKLYILAEKLKEAQGEEADSLKKDIQIVKKDLGACAVRTTTKPATIASKPVPKPACVAIEKEIILLKKKLAIAIEAEASEDIERLKKEMGILQDKYSKCVGSTTQIKKPCDEVALLKETLEQLYKKIAYIKDLIAKGEMKEGDLESYYKDESYLRERLDKMRFACQRGTVVEESPCARLAKLEIIYTELNEKKAGIKDEKTRAELDEKLASVVEEIITLKEKCKGVDLKSEKVESLNEMEKAYKAKLKIVIEGTGEEEMLTELRKIDEEKKRLLMEFAQRMGELDVRKTTIIKKLTIKGGEVYLDDIKTRTTKVKVELKDKQVEIESKKEGIVITDGKVKATGSIVLEYENGELISAKSKKKIKVTPGMIRELIKEEVKDLKITDEKGPKYHAKTEKKGRFLGIIPLTIAKEYEVSAENGEIIKEKQPWWSFAMSFEAVEAQSPSLPDLVVEGVVFDADNRPTLTIRNQGDRIARPADGSIRVIYTWYGESGDINSVGTDIAGSLGPGEAVVSAQIFTPRSGTTGLRVHIDFYDEIDESNEDNNIREVPVVP